MGSVRKAGGTETNQQVVVTAQICGCGGTGKMGRRRRNSAVSAALIAEASGRSSMPLPCPHAPFRPVKLSHGAANLGTSSSSYEEGFARSVLIRR